MNYILIKLSYLQKQFEHRYTNYKNYHKVKSHYTGKYRGAAHSICIMDNSMLQEIPVDFHDGSI